MSPSRTHPPSSSSCLPSLRCLLPAARVPSRPHPPRTPLFVHSPPPGALGGGCAVAVMVRREAWCGERNSVRGVQCASARPAASTRVPNAATACSVHGAEGITARRESRRRSGRGELRQICGYLVPCTQLVPNVGGCSALTRQRSADLTCCPRQLQRDMCHSGPQAQRAAHAGSRARLLGRCVPGLAHPPHPAALAIARRCPVVVHLRAASPPPLPAHRRWGPGVSRRACRWR